MTDKLKQLYKKYEELIAYVFFGGMTTLVNIVVFFVMNDLCRIHYLIANAAAWLASVLFAYVTNRKWVFKSKCRGAAAIIREMSLFIGARVMSGLGDMLIMFVCIDVARLPSLLAKIASNVFVVIFNYIFSKLIIFKNKRQ